MTSNPAQHPHFVHIPDPEKVEGVRAYKEPEVPHPLQLAFLEETGERAWIEEMRSLLSEGRATEADAQLTAALIGFDGTIARLCKATRAEDVEIEGWDDLLPILAEWEGPAITGITLGLTNPPDLVFEPGATHNPDLLLALFSDEEFAFSEASRQDLLKECAKGTPAWSSAEEDVEFYCTIAGLAELNTALINCKHRRFLRDGRDGVEGRAPGGYVEYVLGSWLLATRFLQAADKAVKTDGLPEGCRLIAGSVDVNADFVTVLGKEQPVRKLSSPSPEPSFATLTIKPWEPKEDPTAVLPSSGPRLRQRLVTPDPIDPVESGPEELPPPGLFARLFGRFRRR